MRMQLAAMAALAALVLAIIFAVSPHATLVANEVSGDVYAVDILGLTNQAKDLPDHRVPECGGHQASLPGAWAYTIMPSRPPSAHSFPET